MNYIENLNLDETQLQVFNCGFVGLSIDDILILVDIDLYEFEEKYKHYYNLGNSYCKFETLKKIHDKSELGLEPLKEYAKFRDIFIDENVFKNIGKKEEANSLIEPVCTADLIKKMKGE